METEGRHKPEMTVEELWRLFDLMGEKGRSLQRKEALRALNRGRHPNTAGRALNIAQAIWARAPRRRLDDAAAEEIANNAGYGTTARQVRWVEQEYRAWIERGSSSQLDSPRADALLPPKPVTGLVYELDERYWRTKSVRPLHRGGKLTKDFGPLGPEANCSEVASVVVGLAENEFGILRLGATDDIQVRIVSGQERKGLADQRWVTPVTARDDPSLAATEFWLSGGNRDLRIEVRNPTRYLSRVARVYFRGWVVEVEKVERPSSGVTVVVED